MKSKTGIDAEQLTSPSHLLINDVVSLPRPLAKLAELVVSEMLHSATKLL